MEESSSPVAIRVKNFGSCIEQALDRLLTIFSKKRFHVFRAIEKRIVSQHELVPEQPGGGEITCVTVEMVGAPTTISSRRWELRR